MMYSRRATLLPLVLSLLAGCAGLQPGSLPPAGSSQNPAARPHSIFWGIGLSGFISTTIPNGLGEKKYQRNFCQAGSKAGCPLFSFGKRKYSVTASKTSAWSGGSFDVDSSATSDLGTFQYHQDISTTSNSNHISQSVSSSEKFGWIDLLKIDSASKPVGTKAQFKVTTTVKPSKTQVPCDAYASESITFNFSSNGLPGGYSSINGGCVGTKFKFYVNTPAHPGNVIVETVTGMVGQNLNIQGMGSVNGSLCAVTGCKRRSAIVSGTVTYKIESITSGVTFKTASGTKYQ